MGNPILNAILSSSSGIALCWLGNLSWLIYGENKLIAFDLDLDLDLRLTQSPIPSIDIARKLDALFITHEHGDHFNAETAKILAQHSTCKFILPVNCTDKATKIGIPESRIIFATPKKAFSFQDMHIEPIRALHGDRYHAVYRYANMQDCGYIITMGGIRIMQPGDSVLLQDHLEVEQIEILFVSPTEHNTHIDDSVTMITTLDPQYVFAQHFGTYRQTAQNQYWTRGYPDELKASLPEELHKRFHIMKQGVPFYISVREN